MQADLVGEWYLGGKNSPIELTEAAFAIETDTTGFLKVGIEGYFNVFLHDHHDTQLRFKGGVWLTPIEATLSAAMEADWQDAFGFEKLTLNRNELLVGFNVETGIPTSIDVSGGMELGAFSGNATVLMDVATPEDAVLSVDVAGFSLTSLVESICTGCTVPAVLEHTILAVSFDEVFLQLNPGPFVEHFNGMEFQPGVAFRIDNLNLFGLLSGSAASSRL